MNAETTRHVVSMNSKETEQIGEMLGKQLSGGEVIELVSDLGGGKTTFVRGLVHGAGSPDQVASPTFTISRQYQTDRFRVHHFDFYRLHEAGELAQELAEFINEPDSVVVIEWADAVKHVLPGRRLKIEFATKDETTRELTFSYPEELAYLLKGIK